MRGGRDPPTDNRRWLMRYSKLRIEALQTSNIGAAAAARTAAAPARGRVQWLRIRRPAARPPSPVPDPPGCVPPQAARPLTRHLARVPPARFAPIAAPQQRSPGHYCRARAPEQSRVEHRTRVCTRRVRPRGAGAGCTASGHVPACGAARLTCGPCPPAAAAWARAAPRLRAQCSRLQPPSPTHARVAQARRAPRVRGAVSKRRRWPARRPAYTPARPARVRATGGRRAAAPPRTAHSRGPRRQGPTSSTAPPPTMYR